MILVVGDVMTDVIVRPDGAPAPGTDQRATIERRLGGSGANIACWLGYMGLPTRFVGCVGTADLMEHETAFRRCGVSPSLASVVDRSTGSVVALLGSDGQRSFFTDRGANLALCGADVSQDILDGVRFLHISGHTFFSQDAREAARLMMVSASHDRIEVSVDAGSAGWLSFCGPASFRAWTDRATTCFANADEAALLGGGYETLVVTDGAAGAGLRGRGGIVRVEAAPATALIDGVGAGDAFTAGFLAARRLGGDDTDCLTRGCAEAARCVGHSGGRPPS